MAGARGTGGRPARPGRPEPVEVPPRSGDGQSFASERGKIYALELGETAALLAVLWLIARMSERTAQRRQGSLAAGLVTFLDLWVLGRHRLLDVGPLKPLVEQSPVLATLAREPRGTRIADDRLKNMPMLIGQAPISAYRTLDLPAVPELTALAHGPMSCPGDRALGPGSVACDRDRCARSRPDRKPEGPRAGTQGRASRNDRGSRPGQLALRRVVGGRPGSVGSDVLDLACSGSACPRLAGSAATSVPEPATLDDWSGDVRAILAIFDARRAIGGRNARARGMDDFRRGRRARPG